MWHAGWYIRPQQQPYFRWRQKPFNGVKETDMTDIIWGLQVLSGKK